MQSQLLTGKRRLGEAVRVTSAEGCSRLLFNLVVDPRPSPCTSSHYASSHAESSVKSCFFRVSRGLMELLKGRWIFRITAIPAQQNKQTSISSERNSMDAHLLMQKVRRVLISTHRPDHQKERGGGEPPSVASPESLSPP